MQKVMSLARLFAALAILAGAFSLSDVAPASAAGTGCLPGVLKAKLSQIRQKFGPVSIVSTHRPGARIRGSGKRSYHASCRAVDFHPPKGKYRQVVAWLKANHSGGVGTYSCGMHHVHIDNGPRVRFHHCVNAKGRPVGKSRYAKKSSGKKYAAKSSKKRYAKKSSKRRYASKSNGRPKIAYKPKKKAPAPRVRTAGAVWKINRYQR